MVIKNVARAKGSLAAKGSFASAKRALAVLCLTIGSGPLCGNLACFSLNARLLPSATRNFC